MIWSLTGRTPRFPSKVLERDEELRRADFVETFWKNVQDAAVTEAVFARQGLGRLAVDAVLSQDLPVVQGIVLLSAVVYSLVNLSADVLHWLLDPRVRE